MSTQGRGGRFTQIDAFARVAGVPLPPEGAFIDMLAAIAESLPVPIAISSAEEEAEQHVVFCNEPFCELTGYSLEELEGRNLRLLDGKKTEAATKKKIHKALGQGQPTTVTLTSYSKQMVGTKQRLRIQPVKNHRGKHTVTISMQVCVEGKHDHLLEQFEVLAKALPTSTIGVEVVDRRQQVPVVAMIRTAILICICVFSAVALRRDPPSGTSEFWRPSLISAAVGAAGALVFFALRPAVQDDSSDSEDESFKSPAKPSRQPSGVQFVCVDNTPVHCKARPPSRGGSGSDTSSYSSQLQQSGELRSMCLSEASSTHVSSGNGSFSHSSGETQRLVASEAAQRVLQGHSTTCSNSSASSQGVEAKEPSPLHTISDQDMQALSTALEEAGGAFQLAAEEMEIVRPLGFGSYGEVALHQHRSSGALIVVKKVPLRRETHKQMMMLISEVSHGVKLRHPCIVRGFGAYYIADSSTLTRSLCMTFQYAAGGSLCDAINRQRKALIGQFETEWVTGVLVQLASAVSYMHAHGVIHRDLSSDNIFFENDEHMRVLIGDLGLSKKLEHRSQSMFSPGASLHEAHTAVGTPPYMSPELVSGMPYGRASDVWALGVLLFEMLTLVRPFDGTNMMNTCLLILEGQPSRRAVQALQDSPHPEVLKKLASRQNMLNLKPEDRMTLREVLKVCVLPDSFRSALRTRELPVG